MKPSEIAERIDAHLKRFGANPNINVVSTRGMKTSRFYHACAWASGSRVGIRYINYQSGSFMTKADAEEYLNWLDSGGVGEAFMVRRKVATPSP